MSNLGLERALEAQGIALVRTPVGDRYVVDAMRKGGFNLGGEQSGHLIFLDHASTGDGLIGALQVLALMIRTGRPLSELAREAIERVPQVLESVTLAARKPLEDMATLSKLVEHVKASLGKDGRVLVRWSGTEPKLRVMVEGPDEDRIGSDGARAGRGGAERRGLSPSTREEDSHGRTKGVALVLAALVVPAAARRRRAAGRRSLGAALGEWSARVDGLVGSHELATRLTRDDTMIAGRQHERLAQLHRGVPVFGGELDAPERRRRSDAHGVRHLLRGHRRRRDAGPQLPRRQRRSSPSGAAGRSAGGAGPSSWCFRSSAGYRLAWRVRAFFEEAFDVRQVFLDATSGEVLLEFRDLHTQAAGSRHGRLWRPEEDQRVHGQQRLHDQRPAAAAAHRELRLPAST